MILFAFVTKAVTFTIDFWTRAIILLHDYSARFHTVLHFKLVNRCYFDAIISPVSIDNSSYLFFFDLSKQPVTMIGIDV